MDRLLMRRAWLLDDALAGSPSAHRAVPTELALAARLREAGADTAPVPTPEFREALRARLMAVAAVQGVGATAATGPAPSAVSWRQRAAAVSAGVLATAVGASGVAVASSASLPGDPFYGVKRTTEAVQLRLADGDQAEGIRHLQFAATRLREVRALVLGRDAPAGAVADRPVEGEVAEHVREALADMDADTRTGLRLLTGAFRESRATAPLQELTRFAEDQRTQLRAVLPALTGPALVQARESLTLVEGVQAQAGELLMLVDCTATCDPQQSAPVAPQQGSAESPCGCPSTVPPPQTAPVPTAPPSGEQPAATEPGTGTAPDPGAPPPPGSAGEPSSPPPPDSEPAEPPPVLPVPLPEDPTLPPVEPPLEVPGGLDETVDDVVDGLRGLGPALLPAGPVGALLSGWLVRD